CEQQLLHELAAWAERYTSFVVVEAPSLLLLELKASLRLFSGLKRLRGEIVRALQDQGYSALPAIAPTPLAATWLARAGSRRCIVSSDKLNRALSTLPLSCLAWPPKLTASLLGMGLSQVGDLLRLPRDGFSQRFGATHLLELDRALGRLPDPRPHFRRAERFVADCDLEGEQSDRAWLLAACERLLQKLERFLLTRQIATCRLYFGFYHLQHAASGLTFGSARAEQSSVLWQQLLNIRLEQTELPAPVIAIRLRMGDTQALTATTASLGFGAGRDDGVPISHLIERLAARMGTQAVHGIDTVAEHRPDYAWRRQQAMDLVPRCQASPTVPLLRRRPLWMLEQAEPLPLRHGIPCYRGPIRLENGPERIESGWWDDAGIPRDYYVARNPSRS
ncbi:MAG: DNA polymerase Y family protein, partial [Halioglobus sp.]|nr:DNA polymerase Y family protein [Halioglobus sp.]